MVKMEQGSYMMPIDFCHICPTPELNLVKDRKTHLVLAHLIEEDQAYRDFYMHLGEKSNVPITLIMDNSAFEMYKRKEPMYPTEKLIDMAGLIDADYVVMSDYPGETGRRTMCAAEDMIPELKDNGIGTFFCPQSEPGDIEDLMAGYAWGFSHPEIDYIAVSILNIPIAFGVEQDNNLQRFTSRWKWMEMMGQRGFFEYDKKIHFLGMVDGPNEIDLVKDHHEVITTWDSSAAIWCGMNGIKFDHSPTGLKFGKFEKEVDFNQHAVDDESIECAIYNMKYIDRMCS
jgi:hypothetical protein